MKKKLTIFIIFCSFFIGSADCASAKPNLDKIIKKIEKRYGFACVTADFKQTSTIKAMDVSDFASGKIYIKHPGRIRWEYKSPVPQIFISNGNRLWVYKPEENQVMIGNAASFFKSGAGGAFLSDIKTLRRTFFISLKQSSGSKYILKLIPHKKTSDLAIIHLTVLKKNFNIAGIATQNIYGDETLIELKNITFKKNINNSLFFFKIPKNAEILQIGN